MADRLYTSNEADEILSALRFETKLEKATLARMAFALSLAKVGAKVPGSPNFSGSEMKRPNKEMADMPDSPMTDDDDRWTPDHSVDPCHRRGTQLSQSEKYFPATNHP
jgi:hypothetical protein